VGLEKIDQYDENVIKAVGALGGGIAGSGSVCGILTGAVAVISSLHGRGSLARKENPRMWGVSQKLIREFDSLSKEFGGQNCRDIAKVDWAKPGEVRAYYINPLSTRKTCIRLVGDLAFSLGTILEKELAILEQS
jgi:C_GCAxxG_C_C family probable redox protein